MGGVYTSRRGELGSGRTGGPDRERNRRCRAGAGRDALARVEAGDLSTDVSVMDGSEVGLLQRGFNRLAVGLRERDAAVRALQTAVQERQAIGVLRVFGAGRRTGDALAGRGH